MSGFLQRPPRLPDAWRSDATLREALLWRLGEDVYAGAEPELAAMGALAVTPETLAVAARAEQEPPVHVPYSAWGERVDEIRVSDAYVALGAVGVRAGVTALPYEDGPYGPAARLVWGALIALWGPSSALYSCPVAMTDAAARTLLVHGGPSDVPVVEHLVSRDPEYAWTSGQWMTETTGGSDVGRTETVARRDADGAWRLYGTKWFTSATTSEIALTLARPEGAPEGSRGLALFRVHRRGDDGRPNGIVVRRLKDKLGTRALPTAELELDGALAWPVGEPIDGSPGRSAKGDGGGLRRIATMLNLTRIHNALNAAGALGRGLAWARAFGEVREVAGRPLSSLPAHRATLADLAVDHAAALALVLKCCELTGRAEHGVATPDEERMLRGLTPVTKLATARWAVAGTAEAMECLGGVGYCEDSGLPALVRNTHVMPIWEGTTNVLALDLRRAIERSDALGALVADVEHGVGPLTGDPVVGETAAAVLDAAQQVAAEAETAGEDGAREVALSLARTVACAELCKQGAWAAARGSTRTAAAAARLAARGLGPAPAPRPGELDLAEWGEAASSDPSRVGG
ncbi:MAG TPA: acyl-CoA dehydrogenase family protein [Actinomycetota bacterium]|nr:acyl-CoA dehydrogenase family protein [Actinomycetota bacterium]